MIRGRVVTRLINQEVCREKRTNRGLKPPIRVLRIGRCGGGCTSATEDDAFKIALSHVLVKTVVKFCAFGASTLEGRRQWPSRGSRSSGQGRKPRAARAEQRGAP